MNPKLVKAQDVKVKAQQDFERWYGKMRRALNKMESARQKIIRQDKLIAKLRQE